MAERQRGCPRSRRTLSGGPPVPSAPVGSVRGDQTKSERTGGTAMSKVSGPQVVTSAEALERPLPPQIQEALGELVGAAREGLLALSVGVGLSVVHELMEAEVDEIVGPKSKHNPDRTAKRHGHERGSMTLGGRRVQVSRPRVRSADD